jgi:hypothetical protein
MIMNKESSNFQEALKIKQIQEYANGPLSFSFQLVFNNDVFVTFADQHIGCKVCHSCFILENVFLTIIG